MKKSFLFSLAVICLCLARQNATGETWKELLDRADSLSKAQNQDSAIVIGKLALDQAEAEFGSEDTAVARVLSRLGVYKRYNAEYDEAESFYKRALSIRESTLGPEHPDVAKSLNNLANLYADQGKYAEAELLYKRSLVILEKAIGPEHPDVAKSLSNLAKPYWHQGKYAEAEPLCKRALAILEKAFGPEHPDVATSLNNLAVLYKDQGKYAEAEPLHKRALAIREKALGPEHPDVAVSLNNLAFLYAGQGKYAEAEPLHKRALAIREKALGPEHPDVAASLNNLAILYMDQGKYAEAEPLHKRALAIWEKALGPEHPDVATSLNNLANLYRNQGKYTEAEPLFQRALAIWEKALGPAHPKVATSLNNLANLYRNQGKYTKAEPLFQRAVSIRRKNFVDNAVVLSEKDALTYSQSLRNSVDNYLSCYAELESPDAQAATTAADIILSSKGQVSDGMFERQEALVQETDSITLALAESLRLTKFQLSKLYIEGPGEDVESYRTQVDSLSKVANELEGELSRHSASFRKRQDYQNITVDRVASLLPEKSALVEYVKYNYLQLKPDSSIPRYMAIVLAGNGEPIITELGDASEIDPLIDQYREHLLAVSKADRMPTVVDQEDYREISAQLYAKIWQPIENHVTDKEMVFIAPDGALNMVSFAGLMDTEGKYLVERFAMHYLSSGRDLIRLQDKPEFGHGLFALGDPDFDASASMRLAGTPASEDAAAESAYYATRNVRSGCGTLKDMVVKPLPGTRREVEMIASQWRESTSELVVAHYGPDASEENFKAHAPGSRVIHLATHGYFIEGSCQPNLPKRGIDAEQGFVGENPLLLSGLLFAGSNLHGAGADSAQAEDGILTAYEVSALDLEGTEIVVLSACETGLGEVKEGEGVYGLRRAFQMAGARTVVSALWPVSDQATADMMGQLYDKGDESLPETIRNIQLKKIDELQSDNKVDHPFSWGAFIALGDWR